jgi:CP family cyanate transporter-like MFS transporter
VPAPDRQPRGRSHPSRPGGGRSLSPPAGARGPRRLRQARPRRPGGWRLLWPTTAIALLAANLRPAAASIGPLIDPIQHAEGLSPLAAGSLVTLPVLCFGALAPLSPRLSRRFGTAAALAGSLVILLAGLLVRVVPGAGFLFAGTALAGGAIAVANVLLPVHVRERFPQRTGALTGVYICALIGFAALAAGVSVPVADALGGGWQVGLGIWALPAAIALLAWVPSLRPVPLSDGPGRATSATDAHSAPAKALTPADGAFRSLLSDRLAWAVTVFFAMQSACFYSTLAWLPSIFESHGAGSAQAGVLLAITLIAGLAPALAVPSLAVRARSQRKLVVAVSALIAVALGGLLIAPMSLPYLWAVLLGLGQNAAFPLAITLIVLRARGAAQTTALSTMTQTLGYLIAAGAPVGVGALHQLTASWDPALILLLALMVPQALAGLAASTGTVAGGSDMPSHAHAPS